jgi:hypothetical protein
VPYGREGEGLHLSSVPEALNALDKLKVPAVKVGPGRSLRETGPSARK